MEGRFTDPGATVHEFADEVLVRCPVCGGCALVLAQVGERADDWADRRKHTRRLLRCGCGYAKDELRGCRVFGGPVDPYFRLPLWLVADCCGGRRLWAYNLAHLDLLEGYVGAGLRERTAIPRSMSLVERLPAWVKSAKHRAEILRTVRRLRASVPAGPLPRAAGR
ncbi:hypothetical protein J2S46_001053 [Kitasatospora herbaricolor]|uniref:TFIIB-type zinc ribbon-containing protein n=1 Tax=Kitasatospora herbaricolor TaxID=68217 RepID=UPI00174A283E|nr:TFIIB-type zinc ribbon-containing protein [Kitasatospora herbaricolor]MDQ0306497.1 hypothetical protein [Kitasatospora herbaricolor]